MKQHPIIAFIATFLLASCAITGSHPQGFAPYEQGISTRSYRAVSPEGVTWQIRIEDQKPKADLAFWRAALRKRMTEAGYRVLDSLDFQSSTRPGFAWEFSAPMGQSDFNYLVAVIPTDDKVKIIEAAGPVADYAKYRTGLIEELQKQ